MNYTLEKLLEIPVEGLTKTINKIKNKQDFIIKDIGLTNVKSKNEEYILKQKKILFEKNVEITDNNSYFVNKNLIDVPVFSLINLPNFDLTNIDLEYDVEIMGSKNKKMYCANQPITGEYVNNLKFNITFESK